MPVTIASVHWAEVKASRPYRPVNASGSMTHYCIPGSRQGEHHTLVVTAAYQVEYLGHDNYRPTLVLGDLKSNTPEETSAREISRDLVNEWRSQGVVGTTIGPGIFICNGAEPTREELQGAIETQAIFAQDIVNRAEKLWLEGKRDQVNDVHRAAALWLGEDFAWLHVGRQVLLKDCPFCGMRTSGAAPICSHCGRTHDPKLLGKIEERLAAIDKEIEQSRSKFSVPEPQPPAEAPPSDARLKRSPGNVLVPKH